MDIELVASESGLSVESVERAIDFQEAFDAYADKVIEQYPEQISVLYVDPAPATKGYIQFVNEVPRTLSLGNSPLLTKDTLVLTGGGNISLEAHSLRTEFATNALLEMGYKNHIAFYDHLTQKIKVELQLPEAEGIETLSIDTLRDAIQMQIDSSANLKVQGLAAQVDAEDIDLEIIRDDSPLLTEQSSDGGTWLRDGSVYECTSGWAVAGPDGDGIITAAHCNGLDTLVRRGKGTGKTHSMRWRKQVYGSYGDVEYHTTSGKEYPTFYYSSRDSVRDVESVQSPLKMRGKRVCVYGRASNRRTCDHTVEAIDVRVTLDGRTVGSLVRTDSTSTEGGDSGGGWSWNNTAFGVHSAIDFIGRGYFTAAWDAEELLRVAILTR